MDDKDARNTRRIDVENDRYPFCIVWTPLPVITWLIPFIGHMGIADSNGIIYDFAGPYCISEDDFSFGRPTRYLQLNLPTSVSEDAWDEGVRKGCDVYKKRMHNICCDNCHSHVARCLNSMSFPCVWGTNWNMVVLCFYCLFYGKFVNLRGFLLTWGPFSVLAAIVLFSLLIN